MPVEGTLVSDLNEQRSTLSDLLWSYWTYWTDRSYTQGPQTDRLGTRLYQAAPEPGYDNRRITLAKSMHAVDVYTDRADELTGLPRAFTVLAMDATAESLRRRTPVAEEGDACTSAD